MKLENSPIPSVHPLSAKTVNINLYAQPNQDIRELADEIEYRINNNVMRRRAAYGT